MAYERKDIDQKYKWDLTAIYESEAAFDADYALAEQSIAAFGAHEQTMTNSAKELLAALTDMVQMEARLYKLLEYAFLTFSVDTSDNHAPALNTKARNLAIAAEQN